MSEENTPRNNAEMERNLTNQFFAILESETRETRGEITDECLTKIFEMHQPLVSKLMKPPMHREQYAKKQEEMKKLKMVVFDLKEEIMAVQCKNKNLSEEQKEEAAKTLAEIELLTSMQDQLTKKISTLNTLILQEKSKLLHLKQKEADGDFEEGGPSGSST